MRPRDPVIDPAWLNARFAYDPETGVIVHKVNRNSVLAGQVAGNLEANGYVRVKVRGHKVLAHRLAVLLMTGAWPTGEIDHVNRDKSDNRWVNLREASSSANNHNRSLFRNNTSGAKGVQWRRQLGKWQAIITVNRKRRSLGHFIDFEDAVAARRDAELAVSVASKTGRAA